MSDSQRGSKELQRILRDSQRLAAESRLPWSTTHMLLGIYSVPWPSQAREVLEKLDVHLEGLLKVMEKRGSIQEQPAAIDGVVQNMRQLAQRRGEKLVGTLHLLAALCRYGAGSAYQSIKAVGCDPARVRTTALRLLSERRAEMARMTPPPDSALPESTPAPPPQPPSAERSALPARASSTEAEPPSRPRRPWTGTEPGSSVSSLGISWTRPPGGRPAEAPQPARDDATGPEETGPLGEHDLDPREYPLLVELGRNLTALAAEGKLRPTIGREVELETIIGVLLKMLTNNPVLVGEAGVGKTAIVEGVAQRLVDLDEDDPMYGRILVEVEISGLEAKTQYRGAFTEKMRNLIAEVGKAEGHIIVFFDEIHMLVGAGASEGSLDAGNILKTALDKGDFPCVGATTNEEYLRTIERDPALKRRFQRIDVTEPSPEDAVEMVHGTLKSFEEYHKIRFEEDAAKDAVDLAQRYVRDRPLPASAFTLVDGAASRTRQAGGATVGRVQMGEVVSAMTKIPTEKVLASDQQRMLCLAKSIGEHIVGHRSEIERLCGVLRRRFVGFHGDRPIGSFLLLGPTGVGKTETAKVLAQVLFEQQKALTHFNMSEYAEAASLAKLLGAPPSYVGYDDMSALARAVWNKPYQVLLFDEVEKSHPELWPIFLQMLEEGVVQDRRDLRLNFRETIIVMTSNLGSSKVYAEGTRGIGFSAVGAAGPGGAEADARNKRTRQKILEEARKGLPPELWARFDAVLAFGPLGGDELADVARLMVREESETLVQNRNVSFRLADDAVALLLDLAAQGDKREGARAVRRVLDRQVINAVSDHLYRESVPAGAELEVFVEDGRFAVR